MLACPLVLIAYQLITYQCLGFVATLANTLRKQIKSLRKIHLDRHLRGNEFCYDMIMTYYIRLLVIDVIQVKEEIVDPRIAIIESAKGLISNIEHLEQALGFFLMLEVSLGLCLIIFSAFFSFNIISSLTLLGIQSMGLFLFGWQNFMQLICTFVRMKVQNTRYVCHQ